MLERIGNPVRIGSEPITVSPAPKGQTFSPFMVTVLCRDGKAAKEGMSQKTYLGMLVAPWGGRAVSRRNSMYLIPRVNGMPGSRKK